MKAEIRGYHSPDVDLENWTPDNLGCFGFLLQVFVGPQGADGEESFDFIVGTPSWLEQIYGRGAVVLGHSHVIVFEYEFEKIRHAIERLVSHVEGDDWEGIATRIARYGAWEFDDYE